MEEKKKIKVAVLDLRYAGNFTSVNDLLMQMDNDRFEFSFYFLFGKDERENHFEKAGCKVKHFTDVKRFRTPQPKVLLKLIKALRENEIDILHCHSHKPTIYGALAGIFLPKLRVIAHVHGLGRTRNFGRKVSNLLFLWRVNKLLPVAKAVKKDLFENNWCINESKVTVLDNTVDYERFTNVEFSKQQARESLGLPIDATVFGTVGRFSFMKGYKHLIDAFSEICKGRDNCHLVFVGDGALMQKMVERAEGHGCGDKIHFLGRRMDVELCIKAMDIFVMSSVTSEGMPRAMLEAMAMGLPCVGTYTGGISEIIDEEVGVIVESGKSDLLAEAMVKMADISPEELQRLSENATQRVKTKYSHDIARAVLQDIYENEYQEVTR